MRIDVATYDPARVTMSIGGVPVSGYAEGTFINVTRDGDAFTKKRGSAGDVERTNTNVFDFSIELTLMQTASFNAVLSAMLNTDQVTNGGVTNILIKDLNGTTLMDFPQAWIRKDADGSFGNDTTARTWTFDTGRAAGVLGGN